MPKEQKWCCRGS